MSKNSDNFSSIIKAKIAKYANTATVSEEGKVVSVSDGIVIVTGLSNVMLNEMVQFANGSYGMALNLETDYVGVVMLGKYDDISEDSIVKRTKKVVSVGVGDELIGRIVDPLGNPLDDKGPIKATQFSPIDQIAPGVMKRKSVNVPMATGILAIDSMFPVGRGQRELIIGDRQTGKTSIAIDTIINQKGKNVKCVYVAIGQKNSTVANIAMTLAKYDALEYTTIVSSTASDIPAIKYIAPFSGITIAEYWCQRGEDVLIIFDDLSKHAVSYRTISLLLRRPPGREAYPGDIFYLHSRLLERACRLNEENGNGSITALPIIETQAGDISAYIPTNVISITDGQLFMNSSMFNEGQRPAVSVGLSVSRVGSAAQIKAMKQMASSLKLELAQYEELSAFSQFGSELDEETKNILEHGKRIMAMIKQPQEHPIDQIDQSVLLFAIKYHFIKWIPLAYIEQFRSELIYFIHKHVCYKVLVKNQAYDEVLIHEFKESMKSFIKQFIGGIKDYDPTKVGKLSELDPLKMETTKEIKIAKPGYAVNKKVKKSENK